MFNEKFRGERPYKLKEVAGILLVTLVLCLLFCSTNLVKWAESQNLGPARDISLAVITPVHSFAHFLYLDVPENLITSGFEKIGGVKNRIRESRLVSRVNEKKLAEANTFSSENPLQVLCFGDSNIAEYIGINIQRDLLVNKAVRMERLGKYSTGLSRIDFFDWPKQLDSMLSMVPYKCAILMIGENDAQDFYDEKKICRFGTESWDTVYTNRFHDMLVLLFTHMDHVFVIGLPPMRDKVFNTRMARLNRIYRETSALFPGVVFVDTIPILGDANGNYQQYMTVDKKQVSVRQLDGIHVSDAGGKFVSAAVAELFAKMFIFAEPKAPPQASPAVPRATSTP
jgi:hypothetical protein